MNTILVNGETAYECVNHCNYYITMSGKLFSVYKKGYNGDIDLSSPHAVRYGEDKDGYFRVVLSLNKKKSYVKVHTLVAEQFIGPIPEGLVVNHIDGDKHNNHADNLEIVTVEKNNNHAHSIGLCPWDVPTDVLCEGRMYHFNSMSDCTEAFPILSRHYLNLVRENNITTQSVLFKKENEKRVSRICAFFNGELIGVYKDMQSASKAFGMSRGSVSSAIKTSTRAKELNKFHVTFPNVSTNESIAQAISK